MAIGQRVDKKLYIISPAESNGTAKIIFILYISAKSIYHSACCIQPNCIVGLQNIYEND